MDFGIFLNFLGHFTSCFNGMVKGWVGMSFFLLLFWGRLAFGPTFLIFKFRSCPISQHDKPQNSFRNGQFFKIFQIFRIFLVSEFFKFSEFFWFYNFSDFKKLPDFPFPSMLLRPRNTLAAAGSL